MVQCAWASQDERGKLSGGHAGDQTGSEIKTGSIYNFGQTAVYRCKDRAKGLEIGAAAKAIALNNHFGYDQSQRTSGYLALKNVNWAAENVTTAVELDCSIMAACAVNAAYKKALLPSSVYSGNIGTALTNTGLFEKLTASKYLGKSEYIQCGDIIVAPGKHVIIAYTDGSKTAYNTSPAADSIIKAGQQHAVRFTGVKIAVDGIAGTDTNKMKKRVLQHAINLDYKQNLVEDGIIGTASTAALGTHYVQKGEKQYMVTAAEILMYLNGIDPNGVELPGVYGNGLVNAAKTKFGGTGQKITASDFLELVR